MKRQSDTAVLEEIKWMRSCSCWWGKAHISKVSNFIYLNKNMERSKKMIGTKLQIKDVIYNPISKKLELPTNRTISISSSPLPVQKKNLCSMFHDQQREKHKKIIINCSLPFMKIWEKGRIITWTLVTDYKLLIIQQVG